MFKIFDLLLSAAIVAIFSVPNANAKLSQMPFPYPSGASGYHFFDDFVTAVTNVNYPLGNQGWQAAANAGGYIGNATAGAAAAGQAGRIGLISLGTGTTSNATGQAFLSLSAAQMYAGIGAITWQWAAQVPSALSTSSVEYIMDMGFGVYPFEQGSNGLGILYQRTSSTNFMAYTSNNGTETTCTTADATHFAVVAGTWYNFEIVIPVAGTSASFYVAPAGSYAYVKICTITTNLPDISDQASPMIEIYKTGSSTTTNRIMNLDWVQGDIT